ncbi:SUMF1/EgtB/PvdO family nonheme iron enzyme [Nocardia mexicana]|uniref:Formylglycine-generating enzyme required for sulfatase activity n=1 Tax=Nocardia mexicana TaxID=279262 RepID=A0A370GJL6_9NOCA|nr:SUMF1/EgtB/PvdO family nonheme iron enzyme [Nocardia mexicana]RDI43560.1 formylglycine-generating enzyme required for sulfatase activity [Nocardia mexicana]
MVGLIRPWTGDETRALRDAQRMTLRQFAALLGVNERLISKWEAGGKALTPRPVNQEALDTVLSRLDAVETARFIELVPPDAIGEDRDVDAFAPSTRTRHPVDGKWLTWIPEGVCLIGPQDKPEWVPGFWIDTYPVTNSDYSRFVAATGHTPPQHWADGHPPPDLAEHPVVWVSHDDATAYAEWANKQLPTSVQWEKAARGTRGNTYPWGNQATPAKCNVRGSGPGRTTPVDTYKSGTGPFGAFDLCGNVWEWQQTPTTDGRYELKGSAFTSPFDRANPAAFNDADHTMTDDDTGFRCITTDPIE